ncbi:hypothetical protein B566_EDAN011804 [Ephemera danica]|nr:hypothetical protein B566_EDAN011804 [Ephemera danica]
MISGYRNENINLSRDDRGKPFLANNSKFGILFNVSHQGDFAVLVGAKGVNEAVHRLGVDVMKSEYTGGKNQDEFFRIMGRNFSTEEWINIRGAGNETSRLAAFCRHWSLKESYVKATGTGITVNLQDISFKIHSPLRLGSTVCDTSLSITGQSMTDWKFEENLLNQQHCVGMACNFPFSPDGFKILSIAELISDLEPFLPPDPDYCKAFFAKDERPK